ncbi:MAG TPA: hypothetical protein VGG39_11065 [Polyangiaceae bacterium]|jgi:DNA-directed RNA polymerase specialized sigma24 family protein
MNQRTIAHPEVLCPDTTGLVASRDVVGSITGTLVRHGRRRFLEDDVAEVQTRALEAARRGPMPRDLGEWKALAATIAERYALDEKDKARVRREKEQDVRDNPGAYGTVPREPSRWDPVDAKRYLAVLVELFEAGTVPEQAEEILIGVADGITFEEIAEETGLTHGQVKGRLEKMRALFRGRITDLGMLALLLVVASRIPVLAPANGAADHAMAQREAG